MRFKYLLALLTAVQINWNLVHPEMNISQNNYPQNCSCFQNLPTTETTRISYAPSTAVMLCPKDCSCSSTSFSIPPTRDLSIKCRQKFITNDSQLLQFESQINNLILELKYLERLEISDTPMQNFPNAVCLLDNLQYLDLSRNRLAFLPSNCFKRLQQLQYLKASDNKISQIDVETFSNKSDMPNLRAIWLMNNQISTLEPWPLIRAQVNPGITVRLESNLINKFTNEIEWRFKCGMKPIEMNLYMSDNPITHITNMLKIFGFERFIDFRCMLGIRYYTDLHYSMDRITLACDCTDYRYFLYTRIFNAIQLDSAICSSPENLRKSKILTVNMDQLVCKVTDLCPHQCSCSRHPSSVTYHINCSNSGMSELPEHFPPINTKAIYKYNLTFSYNNMKELKYHECMKKTRSFIAVYSGITNIDSKVWNAFKDMEYVQLEGNKIETLPPILKTLNYTEGTQIGLGNNPLACTCENRWMKSWLENHRNGTLIDHEKLQCATPEWLRGKNIFTTNEDEFCNMPVPPNSPGIHIISSVSGTVSIIALGLLLLGVIMRQYRIKLHSVLKIHWFDRDECSGEEMLYDVFLTCPYEDRMRGRDILAKLESGKCRVCYHERDFPGGHPIMENITTAIFQSKRTLCLLSPFYIKSSYCMEEFIIAYHRDVQMKKRRLVVLMMESVDLTSEGITEELQTYLTRYTYIDYNSDIWLDQVMYAMPINRFLDQNNKLLEKISPKILDGEDNISTTKMGEEDVKLYVIS